MARLLTRRVYRAIGMGMDLTLRPIGYLESCYRDKFAVPRQSTLVPHAWSKLQLEPWVQPELALQGLGEFSHAWLIFSFHKNTNERYHAKVHPPRLQGESIGVFATRSPHRPNNVGLSLVRIEKVEADSIVFLGADLIEGTPIYDIKPYLPELEAVQQAQSGWLGKAHDQRLKVQYVSQELKEKIIQWAKRSGQKNVIEIVEETLSRDPRPLVYKQSDYKEYHAFRIYEGDVHFKVINNDTALVTDFIC